MFEILGRAINKLFIHSFIHWSFTVGSLLILMTKAAVTLHKNKKIAILALTPTLNLTQTLTLGLTPMLILTQTQNLT